MDETRAELLKRISVDPNICFGKPCIRGHRIWVSLILDLLAEGVSVSEVLDTYPDLTETDIRACIAYGSEMFRERYGGIGKGAEAFEGRTRRNPGPQCATYRDPVPPRGSAALRTLRFRVCLNQRTQCSGEAMQRLDRISVDANQMGGVACIRHLRIPVATVLSLLADGMSTSDILDAYPDLETEDIHQALHYAAYLAQERDIPISPAS